MKNNLLSYLSIAENELRDHADKFDSLLAEHDNGNSMAAGVAKSTALQYLDNSIAEIIGVRNKIANKPLAELKKEFDIKD